MTSLYEAHENLLKHQTRGMKMTYSNTVRRLAKTLAVVIGVSSIAAIVGACSGTNTNGTFMHPQQNVQHQVTTSLRKSHVSLQPGFQISNNSIRTISVWGNKGVALGCYVSYPPGCSTDTWRSPVDFNSISHSFTTVVSGWISQRHQCNPPVSTVNSHNDYTYTCRGPWYSNRGKTYKTSGTTTYDVKDDGKANFTITSGVASRALH